MFHALLPAYAIGAGGRVKTTGYHHAKKDREQGVPPCAQSGRRMNEKGLPLTGRVDQWRGMAEKWIGSPWFSPLP